MQRGLAELEKHPKKLLKDLAPLSREEGRGFGVVSNIHLTCSTAFPAWAVCSEGKGLCPWGWPPHSTVCAAELLSPLHNGCRAVTAQGSHSGDALIALQVTPPAAA